ncbi:MAG: flagellar assembly protein FliH [Deltaproteobacteria bacterium]|nr:flagellar assembly protein FliH [Deltaproteobacteria bacterium]
MPDDLLRQARRQAEAILDEARADAEEVRASARAEAQAAAQAAQAAREEQGLREGARLRAEVEEEVVGLALAIAGRVLALAVEDPRAARESALRALRQAGACQRLVLRCHPTDEASLAGIAGELGPTGGGSIAVQGDPSVGKGGVLLETEAGEVDARVERQLERLGRGLLEAG